VAANLKRLSQHDCTGFLLALPTFGTENLILQTMPNDDTRVELDEKPRDQILEKCRKDTESDWWSIDLQHASVEAIFANPMGREVTIFFHKEKRWKDTIDVRDDPEALVVKLTNEPVPAVHTLYVFTIEGVHLSSEWAWKYGWASHQRCQQSLSVLGNPLVVVSLAAAFVCGRWCPSIRTVYGA